MQVNQTLHQRTIAEVKKVRKLTRERRGGIIAILPRADELIEQPIVTIVTGASRRKNMSAL